MFLRVVVWLKFSFSVFFSIELKCLKVGGFSSIDLSLFKGKTSSVFVSLKLHFANYSRLILFSTSFTNTLYRNSLDFVLIFFGTMLSKSKASSSLMSSFSVRAFQGVLPVSSSMKMIPIAQMSLLWL